jgi:hypothetical protein
MVSKGGGVLPRWRNDGKELFYLTPDRSVMAVEVSTDPVFQTLVSKSLFKLPAGSAGFDATADGKRFLTAVPVSDNAPAPFTVVLNWQADLKN